ELYDWEKYFTILKTFIKKFSKKAIQEVFSTKFGNSIFWGYDHFHWCLNGLFIKKDLPTIKSQIEKLLKSGLSTQDIINSIDPKYGRNLITLPELRKLSLSADGISKKMLDLITKLLYGIKPPERVAFYKNIDNRSRKFPIPK
ncbi:MAG: hypothetical protein C4539_09665, partial [Ignavibacteriales bacterium]